MPPINCNDIEVLLPFIILVIWACLLLLVDLFIPKKHKWLTALLAAFGLALTLGFTLSQLGSESNGFCATGKPSICMVVLDGFSVLVNALLLLTGLLGVALAYGYLKRMGIERGEYYTLMLFSISGMMLMAQASDLIIVFLALELLSLPLYVLSAFARSNSDSQEAGLKYFLLGAFSSGFILYGIVSVYGPTGSTSLSQFFAMASVGSSSLRLTTLAPPFLVPRTGARGFLRA